VGGFMMGDEIDNSKKIINHKIKMSPEEFEKFKRGEITKCEGSFDIVGDKK